MEKTDIASVVTCLTDAFTQSEPMTSFLKIKKEDFSVFVEKNCLAAYEDKLSIIAETDKKIVGVRLTSRYKKTNPIVIQIPTTMLPIIVLLDQLHSKGHADLVESQCIHMKMLGVNEKYRNAGLAQNLLVETFKQANYLKYQYALVEATSEITQHIFLKKFQFKVLNKICYQSFAYQKQLVFVKMKKPKNCILMGKTLAGMIL